MYFFSTLVYYRTYASVGGSVSTSYGTACDERSTVYDLCYSTDSVLLYCNNGVATNCTCPNSIPGPGGPAGYCDWYFFRKLSKTFKP